MSLKPPPWNVLVFPGGTEIGLEVCSALRSAKEVQLFSAGLAISNHAPFVFARHYTLPSIHERGWIDELNALIGSLEIDFVIPAYDDVIVALASEQARIAAKIVTSPVETCLTARSKSLTYAALNGLVPCPTLYDRSAVECFPVFAKPDRGQGSQGARLIENRAALALVKPDDLLLEYLPGEEFTVDCFTGSQNGLLFARGRKRIRVRNGISVATAGVDRPEFLQYAKAISSRLTFRGAWFFQVKESQKGELKLLEVAPRIAGAMAFHRVQGLNFPLLSLYEHAGMPVEVLVNKGMTVQLDRALINRYRHDLRFRSVYIDLDDTLLVRDAVDLVVVSFLYQCVNSGVKVILVTKHAGDLEQTLQRHRLSQLFDKIIHVRGDEEKSEVIPDRDAIFIDDSFSERLAVHRRVGIPTFDLSMVEMLIDYTGPTFKFCDGKMSSDN